MDEGRFLVQLRVLLFDDVLHPLRWDRPLVLATEVHNGPLQLRSLLCKVHILQQAWREGMGVPGSIRRPEGGDRVGGIMQAEERWDAYQVTGGWVRG